MIRKTFEQSLQQLQDRVIALGSAAGEALGEAVAILQRRDFAAARALIERDRALDDARYAIEAEALMLVATQNPVAGDMRTLAAALFIANELERIADYAKGIARVNIRIGEEALMKPLIDIPRMAKASQTMLQQSLEAYARRDADLARAVIAEDDTVDALYDQVYAELMTLIMQDPSQMRQANLLLMVAHNLERAADRATNVCERVIYCVTGKMVDSGWEEDAI